MHDVLLITVDSLRDDYVFGEHAPPGLETLPTLAADGIRCQQAYSNAAYTKASFLSMLSGTYPWMFDGVDGGFGPDRPHLAELCARGGMTTAGFHTNPYLSPTYHFDRGFDHYLGRDSGGETTASSSNTLMTSILERALATPGIADVIHTVYQRVGRHLGIQLGSTLYQPAEDLNASLLEYVAEQSGPRFLWIHYMDVHNPYYPHPGTVSEDIDRKDAIKLFHKATMDEAGTTDEEVATLERLYRGEIEQFDRHLGSLLEDLGDYMDLEDTLIVFASDHGEAFKEKGELFHHGHLLYEENLRVPLIVRGPNVQSETLEVPCSNVDIAPTVLNTLGRDPPEAMVGEDLRTLDAGDADRIVFAHAYNPDNGRVMAVDGRYKLIRDMTDGGAELYDLEQDPHERTNRIETEPTARKRLEKAIDAHLKEIGQKQATRRVEMDEEVRLRLKKLGYRE